VTARLRTGKSLTFFYSVTVSGVGYDYDREFLIIYTQETLTSDLNLTLTIQFVRYEL
jgi:hypothetical protein